MCDYEHVQGEQRLGSGLESMTMFFCWSFSFSMFQLGTVQNVLTIICCNFAEVEVW